MKYCDLCKRQVVCIQDGCTLGRIVDFEFNSHSFEIESICVHKRKPFPLGLIHDFFMDTKIIININRIYMIGPDVILINSDYHKNREDK